MSKVEQQPDLDKTDERLSRAIDQFNRVRTNTKKRSLPKKRQES